MMVLHKRVSSLLFVCVFLVYRLDAISEESKVVCSGSRTASSSFDYSLRMKVLGVQASSTYRLFNYFKMTPAGPISNSTTQLLYLSYLCRGDLNSTRCRDCVSNATDAALINCATATQVVVWREVCVFRYWDKPFWGTPDESPVFVDPSYGPLNQTSVDAALFGAALGNATNEIVHALGTGKDTYGMKYAFTEVDVKERKIYAVGECSWELHALDCAICVHDSAQKLPPGMVGGRVMLPSCNFRYEMHRFSDPNPRGIPVRAHYPPLRDPRAPPPSAPAFQLDPPDSPNNRRPHSTPYGKGGKGKMERNASFGSTLAVLMLLLLSAALFCTYRSWRNKKMMQASMEMEDITSADSFQLELGKIRAATHNFAADKKLGQGGFGQVYMGKLESGEMIAVKRLSRDSKQGIAEFKTEILLVANLQHRNLVKLLGFCFSGKEKILVYEYLSNSSLDRLLFDPVRREALNWETRFRIISGIGKGLLYLHEDSRLKIIHRDLKTSNILLDDFMNPKISDFGMAKLFGVDQTQDATKTIVGTYGYMAPEYMLTGQYSVKSDVYSFGIIVLEMVTGLRNSYMSRPLMEEALLHRAWRLWSEGAAFEMVDYVLGDAYSREEVIKCIHIALLCIQEDASLRPNMTWVVAAIRDETNYFPAPSAPNFFNSIRRSASGSCSTTDPGFGSFTGRDSLTDLHAR